MEDDDITLMMKTKAGDRAAFDGLVKRYAKPLMNYIYRFCGTREDARDLSQEVFVKAYMAAKYYTASAKFSTWLYRIAFNTSVDYLRKKRGARAASSLDEARENEEGRPERQYADENHKPADSELIDNEKNKEINRALSLLPENQRAAVILKTYEDRSYSEIASVLGVSVPSVESLIFRARQSLKKLLKEK